MIYFIPTLLYAFRTSNFGSAGGGLGALGRFCSCKIDIHAIHGARKGFASMELASIEPTWTYLPST